MSSKCGDGVDISWKAHATNKFSLLDDLEEEKYDDQGVQVELEDAAVIDVGFLESDVDVFQAGRGQDEELGWALKKQKGRSFQKTNVKLACVATIYLWLF